MKVSLNWAQSVSNVPLAEIGIEKLLEKIGAQLGAVEEVIEYGPRYDGIVVAKVVSCVQHPDANKLSLCTIDDGGITPDVNRGENGYVQVVCGAPNVKAGLVVAWIPPGATVPSTFNQDPFVLEAREIRGQISNGMLASSNELGISDNHDGILEIDDTDAKPGQPFKELYGLDDVVIDIENKMFTHRPDCFGVLGVARELAGIQEKQFTSPDWYTKGVLQESAERDVNLSLSVETDLVPRFMAVAMKHVNVEPSPIWLQAGLTRVGLKPINNIVDITNYLMYVTGQPLHAYDADKLPQAHSLGARMSRKGEKLNLLNGKELEMQDDSTVVITSGDTAVGIGGVMGGKDTEVSAETKNIIIECAGFDMYNVRRTSMKYGLFTDAVTRFTKGQSNLQNSFVLVKAIDMVKELSGAMQSSNAADVHGQLLINESIKVSTHFINDRLGSTLNTHQMASLLTNVEFDVALQDELIIKAPFWRTDIEIPEDIVEEVGRLHGFDNLPLVLPARPSKPATRNALLEIKSRIRELLSSAGANELLTYSFVHGGLMQKVGQSSDEAFQLSNALSPDLQYYRMSLLPSLLEKVHLNIKAGHDEFVIFEMSKVHSKKYPTVDGLPEEIDVLATAYINASKSEQAAYYQARKYLDYIASSFGVEFAYLQFEVDEDLPAHSVYEPSRTARIGVVGTKETIGMLGEFKASTRRALKLPENIAGFEVDIAKLIEVATTAENYKKLSKYPSVQQDISLRLPSQVSYQQVYDVLADELLNKPNSNALITPLDIYQKDDDAEHKQMAFRLVVSHYDKTLKSEEVNAQLDAAAKVAQDKLGAERL